MRTLHHIWLSPFCRKVRIVLAEKKMDFKLQMEEVWERNEAFLALNPAGEVPVLVEPDGLVLSGSNVICEFLDEIHPDSSLIGRHPQERAEVRRLVNWFDEKFNREVSENLIGEKVMKRFLGLGQPDSRIIRAGNTNIHYHLEYVGYLIERRKWLACDQMSLADIAAAAHLSAMD